MADLPPVPLNSPVLQHADSDPHGKEPFRAKLHRDMVNWLRLIRSVLGTVAQQVARVSLTNQSASIVTTDIPGSDQGGLTSLTYSLRVTQAATVSSSATLTLGWTSNSVSASQTFAPMTGNTTATQQSGTITVQSDAGATINYAVLYATAGLTSMIFALDVRVESLP